jgi:hypothetical protein
MLLAAACNRGVTLIARAGLERTGIAGIVAPTIPIAERVVRAINVNCMSHRRPPSIKNSNGPSPARGTFRQRYDDLETQREALMARLRRLGSNAQQHPGYKRALKLLNDTFRKSKLAQRLAVLQAAAWLIDVLEQLTATL